MDDCGGAFTMGAIGGGIFQAVKGFRNSPSVCLADLYFLILLFIFCVNFLGGIMTMSVNLVLMELWSLSKGINHRLRGSLTAIRTKAPQLGGTYTLYMILSIFESSVQYSIP